MTASLKAFYKEEFIASNITIEELCKKYSIVVEELGDISDWYKNEIKPPVPSVESSSLSPTFTHNPEPDEGLKRDILDFKKRTIKECLARLRMAPSLDIKELKDLVSTVDIVDKSLKTTKEGQNVNVLIQNILNKYGDDV